MMPHLQLQAIDQERLNEDIFEIYKMLMKDYLKQRSLVPEGQLVEVSFESLEENPMGVLKGVYDNLDIEGFERARPFFQNYVDQMKSYRKNRHEIDPELVKRIEKEWGFALKEWGYDKTLTS